MGSPAEPDPLPRAPGQWRNVVFVLVGVAAAWYLLLQLAAVLRPLLVAVFLAYVLMPYHARLRRRIGTPASIAVLAGGTAAALLGLALIVSVSVLELADDLPRLQGRADDLLNRAERLVGANAPWAAPDDTRTLHARLNDQISQVVRVLFTVGAGVVVEACVVALYLLFLLLEGAKFPDRVRRAYPPERAAEILQVAGEVNAAVISYLKAKVKSSLVLAVPAGLVLWALGVRFALLWAVLTFLCNFIPYIGTVVAYALPVGFGFLWFGPTWEPVAAAGLLLAVHGLSSSVAEPMILGNAVGVSPLVILGSLAFWGLLWGVPGMFLAVPLTAVLILVMDHFDQTRAVARLLKGG